MVQSGKSRDGRHNMEDNVDKHKIIYKDLKQYRVKTGEVDGVYACRLYKGRSKKPVAVYPSLCDLVVSLGPYKLHLQGNDLERNDK